MAIGLGASDYLPKNSASGELFTVSSRRSQARPTSRLSSPRACLSVFFSARPRACARRSLPRASAKVLQLLAEGRAMKEVADLLQVSTRTVAFHKYTIMEHLGVKTSAELVQYAFEHGMLKKRI